MTTNNENIQRGMALLDAHFSDWRERIDVDSLDMHNCFQCILGQLYADDPRVDPDADEDERHDPYWLGIRDLNLDDQWEDQIKYGFDKEQDCTYEELTQEWIQALTS